MTQLTPIQVDENTIVYVEASDEVTVPIAQSPSQSQEVTRGALVDEKGLADGVAKRATQSFQALESTIRTYTKHSLNAFKNLGGANVDKVTLEFGVNVAGGAGVPYVTQGTVGCSLKVTVECSFPREAGDSHPSESKATMN